MKVDIGEVARRSGVAASALRFYEKKGLISSNGRDGLRRQFAPDVIERLALIALGRSAGLSLDEIARMVVVDGRPRIDRLLLADRADEIEGRIRRMKAVRDGLRHAAECRAADHMECPTFRRLLSAAAAKARRPTTSSLAARRESPAASARARNRNAPPREHHRPG
ncbi:MAG: helix-turn-helix domain-containing protein [Gemmatimonadetes bacterium]|nr:helix-turn-helix domain-containing protein [Gemmatimonadota bacterium]MCC6771701.1 helix-turn-helix domain-containing protein [Gemmatimonadaceae bacterium]